MDGEAEHGIGGGGVLGERWGAERTERMGSLSGVISLCLSPLSCALMVPLFISSSLLFLFYLPHAQLKHYFHENVSGVLIYSHHLSGSTYQQQTGLLERITNPPYDVLPLIHAHEVGCHKYNKPLHSCPACMCLLLRGKRKMTKY